MLGISDDKLAKLPPKCSYNSMTPGTGSGSLLKSPPSLLKSPPRPSPPHHLSTPIPLSLPCLHIPHTGAGKGNHTPATISVVPSAPIEPPIRPPCTYSRTPSVAPLDPLYNQVHDEGARHLMTAAADRFWHDVRSLKVGARGRDQRTVIPRPDFGGTSASGEKANDVIIPYAIDKAPPKSTRARCLTGFDLDPITADT
ncbi:hypothetical protein IAT38_001654 [Cryptococcus sp. DSM 104549]